MPTTKHIHKQKPKATANVDLVKDFIDTCSFNKINNVQAAAIKK